MLLNAFISSVFNFFFHTFFSMKIFDDIFIGTQFALQWYVSFCFMLQTKEQDKNPQLWEWTCSLEEDVERNKGWGGWDWVILPPTIKLMYPRGPQLSGSYISMGKSRHTGISRYHNWLLLLYMKWENRQIFLVCGMKDKIGPATSSLGPYNMNSLVSLRETWICLVLKPEKHLLWNTWMIHYHQAVQY